MDTALLYGNHKVVGEAIRLSGVPREDIFVITKVGFFPQDSTSNTWIYNPNNVKGDEKASIDLAMQQLDLNYIDLVLIHNPCVSTIEYNAAVVPHFFELFNSSNEENAMVPVALPNGHVIRNLVLEAERNRCIDGINKTDSFELRKQSWQNLEAAQLEGNTIHSMLGILQVKIICLYMLSIGKCRYIGVSNYPVELLWEMQQYATTMPAVNELELHPKYSSPQLQTV